MRSSVDANWEIGMLWPHHAGNKPNGKSGAHSVAACIDMEPVNSRSRHAISLYSTLWLTDSLSVELGLRIP